MHNTEHHTKPEADRLTREHFETASFAMGCFWSVEGLFGSIPGVLRSRVGYAGGTTPTPTYWNLADHIETVQIDFDSSLLSFQHLLDTFFQHHKPIGEPWKRQYMSAVFYHDEQQQSLAEQTIERVAARLGRKIYTAVYPYQHFTLAEERHQKYKLQRQPELMAAFRELYPSFPELVHSTAAARVNGYLYGYGKREDLKGTLERFGIPSAGQEKLLNMIPAPD